MASIGHHIAVLRTGFSGPDGGRQLEFAGQRLRVPAEDGIVAEGRDDVVARIDEEHLMGRIKQVEVEK